MPDTPLNDRPKMPDVTKLQIVAVVQFIAGFAAAFGLDLSEQAQEALIQGCSLALIILPLADAWLRGRRATGLGMLAQAEATVRAASVQQPATVVQNAPAAKGDATINTGDAAPAAPLVGGGLVAGDDGTPGHEPTDPDETEAGAFAAAGDVDHDLANPVHADDDLEDGPDGPLDPERVA